jgi:protein-S-isoprenylcysteine O-methyltransferase Ste14
MHFVGGLALSVLWAFFAAAHLAGFVQTGKPGLLLFALAETLVAAFFLLRTRPKMITRNPGEWAVAVVATFAPLLLRPTGDASVPIAEWGLALGATLQIAGVLSLNRSLAVVPALRELKTRGMYRFVRHPLYSSYLLTFGFYLAANFSTRNLLIVALTVGLLVARVHFEERLLGQSPEYRMYRSRVRWRLIPFVF